MRLLRDWITSLLRHFAWAAWNKGYDIGYQEGYDKGYEEGQEAEREPRRVWE